MPRAEFEDGLPRARLEGGEVLDVLQERYGDFASSVLREIRAVDPSAPSHILTFGENWIQIGEMRDWPINDDERRLQQLGATIFGIMGDIYPRRSEDDIFAYMRSIQDVVREGLLDSNALKKLAVLDLTTVNRPIQPGDLTQREDTPWGAKGILRGEATLIYHITSGYARQHIHDILGSPGDDLSISAALRGRRRWS